MSAPWTSEVQRPSDASGESSEVALDDTPTGEEEQQDLFVGPEERAFAKHINREYELRNKQFERDMHNREDYARKAFRISVVWVVFLLILSSAQFLANPLGNLLRGKVGLGTTEFVTVVTSTTVSVLGFWLLVGQYLFKHPTINADIKGQRFPEKQSKNKTEKQQPT